MVYCLETFRTNVWQLLSKKRMTGKIFLILDVLLSLFGFYSSPGRSLFERWILSTFRLLLNVRDSCITGIQFFPLPAIYVVGKYGRWERKYLSVPSGPCGIPDCFWRAWTLWRTSWVRYGCCGWQKYLHNDVQNLRNVAFNQDCDDPSGNF